MVTFANLSYLTDALVRLSAGSVLCRWPHAGKCALAASCCADLQQVFNAAAYALQAGDTPLDTAVATVRRETKLELPRERFSFVCLASYLWQYRQQEPQGAARGRRLARSCLRWCRPQAPGQLGCCGGAGNGTADIALVFQARVTAAEQRVALGSYDCAEYEAAQWLSIQAAAADASLHPAVRRHACPYCGLARANLWRASLGSPCRQRWQPVRSALLHVSLREAEAAMDEAQADDAALLRCGRKLCAARQRVDAVAAMPYANVRCYASRHGADQT